MGRGVRAVFCHRWFESEIIRFGRDLRYRHGLSDVVWGARAFGPSRIVHVALWSFRIRTVSPNLEPEFKLWADMQSRAGDEASALCVFIDDLFVVGPARLRSACF